MSEIVPETVELFSTPRPVSPQTPPLFLLSPPFFISMTLIDSLPQNVHVPVIYSPSKPSRCVCFFIRFGEMYHSMTCSAMHPLQ